MMQTATTFEAKHLNSPEEVRKFDKGKVELVKVAGAMTTRMDDGKEITSRAGDIINIPPGHDAWVVGNEPVTFVDFQGMGNYAK